MMVKYSKMFKIVFIQLPDFCVFPMTENYQQISSNLKKSLKIPKD